MVMPGEDSFQLRYYESVMDSILSGTLALNSELVIASMNPAAEDILGFRMQECVGFPLFRLLDPVLGSDGAQKLAAELQSVLHDRFSLSHELVIANRTIELKASPLVDSLEAVMGVVLVLEDITERKAADEMLRSLSLTDDLTGLYNRRGFLVLAEQQLRLARRMKRSALLLFGDMDKLKAINDTWGHSQGDLAIIEIATVLKESSRESDIVARLGGDEFAILAMEAPEGGAQTLVTRLKENLAARNARGDRGYKLAFSVGIARYDPGAPCAMTDLLQQADGAMYQQKQSKI
jgi:diguanylate cyclase (GGDEF)-like protein/PAS domain S-box-containing protein